MAFSIGCSPISRRCEIAPEIIESVSTTRQLPFKSTVNCAEVKPTEARRFIRSSLNQDRVRTRVRLEGEILSLLGVLAPREDYYELLLDTYASRVSGYYDREKKSLIIASDSSESLRSAIERHELVHALQDQHFNLEALLDEGFTSDVKLARQALMEGDANLVSFLLSSKNPCQRFTPETLPLLLELRKGSISLQDSVALRLLMDFPYLYGVSFACAITAGKDLNALNSYLTSSSLTTRQIVEARSGTTELASSPQCELPRVVATDNSLLDAFGYFFIVSLLAEEFPVSTAFRLAADFECDHLLFSRGSRPELCWQLHWRSAEAAETFAEAYREWWGSRIKSRHLSAARALSVVVDGDVTTISSDH